MKLTVQTATRGRCNLLKRFCESLLDTAAEPDEIELLFWADEDDQETIAKLSELGTEYTQIDYIFGFRGRGYWDHSRFHTKMARVADGQLLMQANDDMLMLTPGWDTLILDTASRFPDGIYVIKINETIPYCVPSPTNWRAAISFWRIRQCIAKNTWQTKGS